MDSENATKQANIKAGKGGVIPPVERQFGKPNGNPRHNGAWRKEDTARFKLESMMKLTFKELAEISNDKERPYFERKLAGCIRDGQWKVIKEMIDEVYGQPKVISENHNIDVTPLVDLTKRIKNGEAIDGD